MASDDKRASKPGASFSFGLRELRRHRASQTAAASKTATAAVSSQASAHPPRRPRIKLSIESTLPEKTGFDPYNTSGSFDRSKNWIRVGKR